MLRFLVFALLICGAAPAIADGGWRACVYTPLGFKASINFTYRLCYIKSSGTECIKKATPATIESPPDKQTVEGTVTTTHRYTQAVCFRNTWTEESIEKYQIERQSAFYLISFDQSFETGYQGKTLRTRTLPFSRFDPDNSRLLGWLVNANERYHFEVVGNGLDLYNGCPVDDCTQPMD